MKALAFHGKTGPPEHRLDASLLAQVGALLDATDALRRIEAISIVRKSAEGALGCHGIIGNFTARGPAPQLFSKLSYMLLHAFRLVC